MFDAPSDAHGYLQVDPAVLAREILRLVEQPELLAQLRSQGRRNWQERYTWNKIVLSYEKVLADSLSNYPSE